MAEIKCQDEQEDNDDEGEGINEGIELTLGLSLNGKFGVDPNANKLNNLRRSFSISNFVNSPPLVESTGGSRFPWVGGGGSGRVPLTRTCSLPVEAEEESRKRKEVQMLRRQEARRRRVKKMTSGSGLDGQGVWIGPPPLSQGSGSGSGSGSSSGVSEFDSQSYTPLFSGGMNRSTEAKSPQSVESLDQNEHRKVATKSQNDMDPATDTGKMVRSVLADMPCVSTKGDGPNGKRIEGFLYRYKKGEEVRIVCVCHGNFLTAAEFIKHAGGGEVEHPLRHIVVNSSSFL